MYHILIQIEPESLVASIRRQSSNCFSRSNCAPTGVPISPELPSVPEDFRSGHLRGLALKSLCLNTHMDDASEPPYGCTLRFRGPTHRLTCSLNCLSTIFSFQLFPFRNSSDSAFIFTPFLFGAMSEPFNFSELETTREICQHQQCTNHFTEASK